ncbi:MAG TPA: hypothetical protein PKA41_01385 [Verrucomicrobiota bacterium]|nr:hypothetical protein [Verrucomicrobiota bacterium]
MKKILSIATLVVLAISADAQLYTNVLPGGDFENPGPIITNADAGSAGFEFSYPQNEGNPNGAGVITSGSIAGWGVLVLGNATNTGPSGAPVDNGYSYANLGLVGGQPYTFQIDMRYDTNATYRGLAFAGFKVEFWNQTDNQSTKTQTGDLRFTATDTNWFVGSTNVTVPANKTHFKFVPLLVNAGAPSTNVVPTRIIFDNARIVSPAIPIFAQIAGPPNGSTVGTNFFVVANAGTFPGTVTNVTFYNGASLIGSDDSYPFSLGVVGATPGPAALWCKAEGADALGGYITATSTTNNVTISATIPESVFTVNPNDGWISFANGYEPSGFDRSSQQQSYSGFYGSDDLQARFSLSGGDTVLTLGPLVNGDTNCAPPPAICWYQYGGGFPPPGDPQAVGYNDFDAFHYVQPSGLNGNLITFKGTNISANLTNPGTNNLNNVGWTCVAFVRDIAADGQSFNESTITVTNGQPFSVSLATIPDLARTVQYGFKTTGPNVMPGARDMYGSIVFQSAPLPPPTNVFVNANATAGWQGYINVYSNNLPGIGEFINGQTFGLDAITAEFGCDLVLSPTVINDTTNYWYVGGGAPGATGNKIVEANTYVQDDSLSGKSVIFSGTVLSTGLLGSTDPGGNGWTGIAFVKDLAPDYSSSITVQVPLTVGAFSITNATQPAPGRHVQYGFAITGPNVWPTEAMTYGTVVIDNVALVRPTLSATRNGSNIDLSFETCVGNNYTVQYKNNISDTWDIFSGPTPGTGMTEVVSDSTGNPTRYYQLLVQ